MRTGIDKRHAKNYNDEQFLASALEINQTFVNKTMSQKIQGRLY